LVPFDLRSTLGSAYCGFTPPFSFFLLSCFCKFGYPFSNFGFLHISGARLEFNMMSPSSCLIVVQHGQGVCCISLCIFCKATNHPRRSCFADSCRQCPVCPMVSPPPDSHFSVRGILFSATGTCPFFGPRPPDSKKQGFFFERVAKTARYPSLIIPPIFCRSIPSPPLL